MNAMKIALLGAMGFVGQTAARELITRGEVRELLLVDYNVREAKKFAKALSPKCRWAMADVGQVADLERLLEGIDAVANAVGPCSEYEKRVFLTCAGSGHPVASIGDGILSDSDRREIHHAFRRAGAGAVSGCGMLPGFTDLLAAHFLRAPSAGPVASPAGTQADERAAAAGKRARAFRFLFCSPDRFGGYAFFRRLVGQIGRSATVPPLAPSGRYFEAATESVLGLPGGRPSRVAKGLTTGLGVFGTVGRELSAAFLFWLRGALRAGAGDPAAAAGVLRASDPRGAAAVVSDPGGRLAAMLLVETVLRLPREVGGPTGLVPLPRIFGRKDVERIAAAGGAEIRTGYAKTEQR